MVISKLSWQLVFWGFFGFFFRGKGGRGGTSLENIKQMGLGLVRVLHGLDDLCHGPGWRRRGRWSA